MTCYTLIKLWAVKLYYDATSQTVLSLFTYQSDLKSFEPCGLHLLKDDLYRALRENRPLMTLKIWKESH